MKCDVVIIGGGPGGLCCARQLAQNGVRVVLLEKQRAIGRKVCAGGITWSGLLKKLPDRLIEHQFRNQTVTTQYQSVQLNSDHPVVATVNRVQLGRYMEEKALQAGAEIITGTRVRAIEGKSVSFYSGTKQKSISFDYLVGADGSHSLTRSYLGMESGPMGIGLNYIVPGTFTEMVWNFDARKFSSGYSWIFPHRQHASIGAFVGAGLCTAGQLKTELCEWMQLNNILLGGLRIQAGHVNYQFRGWNYNPFFLIGDAAGLASPLTGEGIYPAIVSAEAVAQTIIDRTHVPVLLDRLISKHQRHRSMQKFASLRPLLALLLSEMSAFMLKHRIITFDKFEMV